MENRTFGAFFALLFGVPGFGGEGKGQPPDPSKGVNLYSPSREIALGKMLALEVETASRPFEDSVVSEYVNRLAQNLARQAGVRTPLILKVLNSDEVNAVALPGGFLYVNKGVLLQAQNEAEVAGVLAHELAHVVARHATKLATRGEILSYASMPLLVLGGWPAFAVYQGLSFSAPAGLLRCSRGMETQADELGLEYMRKAGYDQTAFIDFIERVDALDSGKGGSAFSTHPKTSKRIQRAQKFIQRAPTSTAGYVLDTAEFQRMKERVRTRDRTVPFYGPYVRPSAGSDGTQ